MSTQTEEQIVYLNPIQLNFSMNHQLSCRIHAMSKAAAKDKNIDPALNLSKHQTAYWRLRKLLSLCLLRSIINDFGLPMRPSSIGKRVVPRRYLANTNIGHELRQIPSLKQSLLDMVAVVSSHEPLRYPALLKESLAGLGELCQTNFLASRSTE
jgi:hypothetical protein